jgi:glycosyltransferase involved in cell wall biosynthesis
VSRPVLLVTNHVPPERAGAFAALHRREGIELALFGGRSHHATAGVLDPGVPHRHVGQRGVHGLAASGRYRAVICGTAGRAALPAAWTGARRAGVPFVLWSALWGELWTPAHVLARPLMAAIYADADAVAAYGPHVATFARAHGARRIELAPQAVDQGFWSTPAPAPRRAAPFTALFVGRPAPEKGLAVLRAAWALSGLPNEDAALVTAGAEAPLAPAELRNLYGGADVVVIPSIRSRRFLEPWGLVANEAMHQRTAVIATDAVGAAAGGLVRHGETGLVVPAGDARALAGALRRVHGDPALRERLAYGGARAAAPYDFAAWARGVSAALAAGGSREGPC